MSLQLSGSQAMAEESQDKGSEILFDESLAQDATLVQWIAEDMLIEAVKRAQMSNTNPPKIDSERLAKASYYFVRSKAFIMAKIKILFMQYPDVLLFDGFMRLIKFAIVLPYLASHGYLMILPLVEVVPEGLVFTGSYAWFRIWLNQRRLTKQFGGDIEKLKQEVFSSLSSITLKMRDEDGPFWNDYDFLIFEDIGKKPIKQNVSKNQNESQEFIRVDLNHTMVHKITVNGTDFMIPVIQDHDQLETLDNSSRWATLKELESMVDNDVLLSLSKLHLNPYFYQNALLQQILETPRYRKAFLANTFLPRLTHWPKLMEFYHATDTAITLFMTQVNAKLPRFALNAKDVKPWAKSFIWRLVYYPSIINRVRLHQLKVLNQALENQGKLKAEDWISQRQIRDDMFAELDNVIEWINGGIYRSSFNKCKNALNNIPAY